MKKSGVKWVGEIPNNWNILSPRYWVKQRDAGNWGTDEKGDEQDTVCIRIADFNYNSFCIRKGYEYTIRNYPKGVIKKLQLRKGDIIIEKSGGGEKTPVGRAIVYDLDIPALFANFSERIRVSEDYSNIFMLYAFAAHYALGLSCLYFNQTTGLQNLIMPKYMREVKLPLPPLPEQKAIADFLDKKCAEIDGLLADLEAEVKTLAEYKKSIIAETVTRGLNPSAPMKDVPLGWIDFIPKHWEVARIASVYSVRNEKVSDKDYPPLSVTMKGIVPQLESAAKTKHGDDRKLIRKGDFVINSRSDRRGSCGISDYDGSCSLINTVLAPREEMNPRYYNWLFHTSSFADEFYKWGYGIVDDLWTTNWGAMRRIQIPVPPLDEQEAIASYLDNKILQIDETTADKQTQIETLKSYKSSLIYEYVTGKKQVI